MDESIKKGLAWSGVAMAIVIVVTALCLYKYYDNKLFVNAGYEQVILPGSNSTKWQKAELKKSVTSTTTEQLTHTKRGGEHE